jgi:2,3-bisphosphoglycerate-independent phosphoglycerate mutase
MADRPLKKLGYKTCLQKAKTPNMDWIANNGTCGKVKTIPEGFEPGSDVANLSILGYNPSKYYSGRAPLEAGYRGIKLAPKDVAFRCNLVTLGLYGNGSIESAVMKDYSAGHITTKEAGKIISAVNRKLGNKAISFYPGISYRHLMVWKNGSNRILCTPPHDISGKKVTGHLPKGKGAHLLRSLMEGSLEILALNRVNINRIKKGLHPANSIWFWGQGRKLSMPDFYRKYKLKGALISAVDLTKGLGISAGFDILNVKGATGYLDTNYAGKANAALKALRTRDFVYVHVEAPDEAGHNGDIKAKIKAIEDFDSKVVGTVLKDLRKFNEYSILLLPDHATPIRLKTHSAEPVPFAILRSNEHGAAKKGNATGFNEGICRRKNILNFEKGHKLMDYFLKERR